MGNPPKVGSLGWGRLRGYHFSSSHLCLQASESHGWSADVSNLQGGVPELRADLGGGVRVGGGGLCSVCDCCENVTDSDYN